MFINIDALISELVIAVDVGTLVEFLGLRRVALILDLRSELAADVLLALGSDLLSQLECGEPVLQIHAHVEGEIWLGAAKEHVLSQVRLEEDASNVTHKHVLLRLVLNALDREDHTNILALLECNLSELQLNEFQALLAQYLEVLLAEPIGNASDLDRLLKLVASQVLQEVAQVALIAVVFATPLVHVRVGGEILATDAVSASVRVHIAVFEDHWLHILIDLGDDTRLGLVNFVEAQVFRQMHDLRAFE